MKKTHRVAVFGGAFDPPHLGHRQIAEYLLKRELVDEIWWLPTGQHAFDKSMSAAADRLAMVRLLLQDQRERVETYELEQPGRDFTYETLLHLQHTHPQTEFVFVMGTDNVAQFFSWHQAAELLATFPIWVYPRKGFAGPIPQEMNYLEEAPVVEVSSTQVRQRIAAGESISELVLPAVADYIKHHQLYQPVTES